MQIQTDHRADHRCRLQAELSIEPLPIGGSFGTVFLVANEGSDSLEALGADDNGDLGVIASIDVEATPIGMTTVDMDGDLDRDLAMLVRGNLGNDIRVYRNDTDTSSDSGILLALDDVLMDSGFPHSSPMATPTTMETTISSRSPAWPGQAPWRGNPLGPTKGDIETNCPGDIDGDNVVNVIDLLSLISAWGPCENCGEDLDDNGIVNVIDLLTLIEALGAFARKAIGHHRSSLPWNEQRPRMRALLQ